MWYISPSAVFVMDTSTIGSTWIVLFTSLWMFSPLTFNGLSTSPTAKSSTFIVIVAVLFAVMFVTTNVSFCVDVSLLIITKLS